MKKPGLSKQGLKKFFLYHSEKLILLLSLALFGLFFWMGYGSPIFDEKAPSELADMAARADQFIVNTSHWETIKELPPRKGDSEVVDVILNDKGKLDAENYPSGAWSVKAKTLQMRLDPRLFKPTDLIAKQISAPVLLSPGQLRKPVSDPLADLPLASTMSLSMGGLDPLGMGMGMGMGMGFDEDYGGRSADASRREREIQRKRKEAEANKIDAGLDVLSIHELAFPGIRPNKYAFSPQSEKSFYMNFVAVTGVVDIKQQAAEYEKSFSSSIGFFPERDRPKYEYVQVERAEVIDGETKDWEDISEAISVNQPSFYPMKLIQMPNSMYRSAPEFVAADYYDPVLTSPIPPISQFDYRPYVTHPKVENREFDDLTDRNAETAEVVGAAEMFDQGSQDRRALMNARQGMFGTQPGMRGAMPGMANAYPGMPGYGSSTPVMPPVRAGSNTSKYLRAVQSRKIVHDYKLIRFFDLRANKPGVTYRYRVRLWIADPNNQIPDALMAGGAGQRMGMGTAMNSQYGMDEMDEMDEMGGMDGMGMMGMSGMSGMPRVPQYEFVKITHKMKAPGARVRLGAAREEVDPKNQMLMDYYVSEFQKSEDGTESLVEIPVPKMRPDLRFSRPTEWSDPVDILIKKEPEPVFAGEIELPRTIKIGDKQLADGEPVTEVVPSVWSRQFNAALPARKQAFRADALDFSADIHVLNPVTWQVHVLENAPIVSHAVVVDMLGGEELPLSRNDLMRHHLPSETLIMNDDGTFHVANDMDDKTQYKQALLEEDDKMEVGGQKAERQRKKLEENRYGSDMDMYGS